MPREKSNHDGLAHLRIMLIGTGANLKLEIARVFMHMERSLMSLHCPILRRIFLRSNRIFF